MFAHEYYPALPFTVVARLSTAATVAILTGPAERPSVLLPRPDEYDGYVIAYPMGAGPRYAFAFSQQSLASGGTYRFSGDVTVFDASMGLLETALVRPASAD
ncbi:MAG: hypothetical protein ABEJ31_12830 [Haloarculaceae archaeon]